MNRPAGVRADDDPKVEPFMLHAPTSRASVRAATMAHAHADVTSRHPIVLGIALGAVLSVAITAGTASSAAAAVDAHSDALTSLATVTDADRYAPAVGAVAMAVPLADISADAQVAVETAQAAVADAAALTAEVAASGLALGTATTAIDTTILEADIADLTVAVEADTAESATDAETAAAAETTAVIETPAPTAPATAAEFAAAAAETQEKAPLELVLETADVTADAADVVAATATLREALTAAQKAAAEKKAAEERAAAAAAAANTPEGAKATARAMAASQYGWGDGEFSCLESLWTKESGWNYKAYNPSGATGIPQSLPGDKMATAGSDWRTNATTQIAWGLGYIDSVYGSPCSAWGHSQATNWY
ncbi:phospholipase [Microbacterium sp. NPDC056234]|uniref:aggregation-promoting factor C-terminal-like domain-containing protein n=1 Tax=Microbacterium sp. NPDC056234 TaxID=3345757 RepID=UPI0035E26962